MHQSDNVIILKNGIKFRKHKLKSENRLKLTKMNWAHKTVYENNLRQTSLKLNSEHQSEKKEIEHARLKINW